MYDVVDSRTATKDPVRNIFLPGSFIYRPFKNGIFGFCLPLRPELF
jgi:hypothetical protein